MIAFRFISVVTSLALVACLSYRRFQAACLKKNEPFLAHLGSYLTWLGRFVFLLFRGEGWLKIWSFFRAWLSLYPQAWQKSILWGLISTFLYLSLSGFGFALLSSRGLFGLPLLLHIIGGGGFSLSLAGIVVVRARDYVDLPALRSSSPAPGFLLAPHGAPFLRLVLFWILILTGLSLVLTALLSMLPYFSFDVQLDLIAIHRYSALFFLLSAILFLDQAIPRSKA